MMVVCKSYCLEQGWSAYIDIIPSGENDAKENRKKMIFF